MGGLKFYISAAIIVALCATAAPAKISMGQVFAGCVGRFSAEMEHAWLMSAPEATAIEALRYRFLSLLDATMPQDAAQRMLTYRIEVKQAHASLLTLAAFGKDVAQATRAARLAKHHVTSCKGLLLDS